MMLPTVKEQMIEDVTKKDEPALLLMTALATIDTYPEEWIKIYTDGSATDGTTNAGYGSYVQLPDGTKEELFSSCGKHCSNYKAEATAITESLKFVSNLFKQKTIRLLTFSFFDMQNQSYRPLRMKLPRILLSENLH